mgnify:CR=1 FL=1
MVTSSSGVTLAAKRLISIKRSVKGISRRRSSNTCFKASLCEAAVNTVAGMAEDTLHYCETHNWNLQKIYKWSEWIYIRLQYLATQWHSPSQELLDCYVDGKNDRRFDLFYVEHGNRRFSVAYDWYRYNQLYDDC